MNDLLHVAIMSPALLCNTHLAMRPSHYLVYMVISRHVI